MRRAAMLAEELDELCVGTSGALLHTTMAARCP